MDTCVVIFKEKNGRKVVTTGEFSLRQEDKTGKEETGKDEL